MSADFVTVFDLAESGYSDAWFPSIGLIAIVIGGVLLLRPDAAARLYRSKHLWVGRLFSSFILVCGLIWAIGSGISTFTEYVKFSRAYAEGKFQQTEGVVENVRTGNCGEKGALSRIPDSFLVDGSYFSFCPGDVNVFFHRVGVLHDGEYVRISYIGDAILKLEIAPTRDSSLNHPSR